MASKEESAASEGETAQEVEGQEKRELEIKGLLKWYPKFFFANITKENAALRKDASDLKALFEFNDKELRDVKSSLANAASAYAAPQKRLDAKQRAKHR